MYTSLSVSIYLINNVFVCLSVCFSVYMILDQRRINYTKQFMNILRNVGLLKKQAPPPPPLKKPKQTNPKQIQKQTLQVVLMKEYLCMLKPIKISGTF